MTVPGKPACRIKYFARRLFGLLFFVAVSTSRAEGPNCHNSYCFEDQPQCPTIGRKLDWYEYLNKNYTAPSSYPRYGVEFRYAKAVNDPVAMNNINRGMCYGGGYMKFPYGGTAAGFISSRNPNYPIGDHDASYYHDWRGLPGNPLKYQVNVDGSIFIYNRAGEIFDHKGRRVGQLVCYVANDCLKYQ